MSTEGFMVVIKGEPPKPDGHVHNVPLIKVKLLPAVGVSGTHDIFIDGKCLNKLLNS